MLNSLISHSTKQNPSKIVANCHFLGDAFLVFTKKITKSRLQLYYEFTMKIYDNALYINLKLGPKITTRGANYKAHTLAARLTPQEVQNYDKCPKYEAINYEYPEPLSLKVV